LCKIDRKIHRKKIFEKIFWIFLKNWTGPSPTTLVWANAVRPRKLKQTVERLSTVHAKQWTGLEKTNKRRRKRKKQTCVLWRWRWWWRRGRIKVALRWRLGDDSRQRSFFFFSLLSLYVSIFVSFPHFCLCLCFSLLSIFCFF